jgi:phosphopantetheinyl transferase
VHEQSLDFNVSHSGSHGLIVLSYGRRVGVDIEMHATDFDWRTVADLALDPRERTHIERLDAHAQLEAFYEIWVMKESILKAAGVGLAEDLRHLSVSPGRDGSTPRQYRLSENAGLLSSRHAARSQRLCSLRCLGSSVRRKIAAKRARASLRCVIVIRLPFISPALHRPAKAPRR